MLALDIHPRSRASKGQGEIIYKRLWHPTFLIDFVELVGQRHDVPLRKRPGHLRMDEVGLELPFALDVDDSSARAHVAEGQQDAARLLRHLGRTTAATTTTTKT